MPILSMRLSPTALFVLPILAAVLLSPLVLRLPNPYASVLINELHDALHTVLYFVADLFIFFLVRYRRPQWRLVPVILSVALCSLAVGGAVELIQPLLGRSGSWADMLRNALGVISACVTFYAIALWRRWRSLWLLGFALALLLFGFTSLIQSAYRQILRDRDFPLLMDFERASTRSYVGRIGRSRVHFMRAPMDWSSNTSLVARVLMAPAPSWSGLVIFNPNTNWSTFSRLNFDVYSPYKIPVRIASNLYSAENRGKLVRYKSFEVSPGVNHLSWDLSGGDSLAKHHITRVSWYSIMQQGDIELYFDNFRLN
jgi:hypothetical protein